MKNLLIILGLAAVSIVVAIPYSRSVLSEIDGFIRRFGKRRFDLFVFLLVAIPFAYYGSTKNFARVEFAYTDVETRYLYDAGSYVTNDAVYVSFTRMLAPGTARFYIDALEFGKTNVDDFVSVWAGTFNEFTNPSFVPFENATNYIFYCYTDWTPGPVVVTNSVLEVPWQTSSKTNNAVIPIRTGIYLGGEKISPPRITIEANLNGGSNEE